MGYFDMIFDRDCLLYSFKSPLAWEKLKRQNPGSFFNFTFENENERITKVIFKWVDPIKVRDKIVANKQKQVMFLIFKSKNYVCFFGNSESSIVYTITKLREITSVKLEKINLFNLFSAYEQNNTTPNIFKLVSIDYRVKQSKYNKQDNIQNIAVSELNNNELKKLLKSSQVVGLVYSMNGKYYFNLDYNSVISFYDTSNYEEILNVCNGMVENVE
jgi:phosphotransferase system IIB component